MVAHACNPSTLGGRGRQITRSRDRDHLGQHSETPSLLKINTKISRGWWYMTLGPDTQKVEVVVSQDCASALQHGQQSKTLSRKMKKKLIICVMGA